LDLFHLSWDGIFEKWRLCVLRFSSWSWSKILHWTISMCNYDGKGFIYTNFIEKFRYMWWKRFCFLYHSITKSKCVELTKENHWNCML
jgi:hypothetical protein